MQLHIGKRKNRQMTQREWLNQLPSDYRERAIRASLPYDLDVQRSGLADSIIAIRWSQSPEGEDFWMSMYSWVVRGISIPPPRIPNGAPIETFPQTMKTVREWLSELPEPYNQLALAADPRNWNNLTRNMCEGVVESRLWHVDTPSEQGAAFWLEVYNWQAYGAKRPEIPRPKEPWEKLNGAKLLDLARSFQQLADGSVHPRQMKQFIQEQWLKATS